VHALHVSAYGGSRCILMVRAASFDFQTPDFLVALKAAQ